MTRVCAELGCTTILSRFNEGPRCWTHQARIDAAERARESASSGVVGGRGREIEAMILAAPAPLTTREIADALGMTPQGIGYYLRALVATGAVERQRVGRRGRGFDMRYAPAQPVSDRLAA